MRIISIQTEEEESAVYNLSVGITSVISFPTIYVYTCSFKSFVFCDAWKRDSSADTAFTGRDCRGGSSNRAYRIQSADRLGKTI